MGATMFVATASLLFFLALLPAAAQGATGSISGLVYDHLSPWGHIDCLDGSWGPTCGVNFPAHPVAGVEVCARPLDSEGSSELEPPCATTKSEGRYIIAGVPAGDYEVEFWGRPVGYLTQYYDGKALAAEAEPVTVGTRAVTGIDAALVEGGTINGTVTEKATGAPFAAVWVCAVDTLREGLGGCTTPDSNGDYTIKGLPAAEYVVQFLPAQSEGLLMVYFGHAYFEMLAESVSVSAEGVKAGIDAEIERGAEIEGTVRAAADGTPIEGARICAWEAGIGSTGRCAESAADGTYLIDRLRPVEHKVEFSAPGMVEQAWNDKPGWNEADLLSVPSEGKLAGIDAYLELEITLEPPEPPVPPESPVPPSGPTPPTADPPAAPGVPKHCRKGFKKKRVKGKVRCVRKHKPRHHRGPAGS